MTCQCVCELAGWRADMFLRTAPEKIVLVDRYIPSLALLRSDLFTSSPVRPSPSVCPSADRYAFRQRSASHVLS